MKELVCMKLEDGMNNVYELFRTKKDSILRFHIGHTLQGKTIRLFTNYPVNSSTFIREKYFEIIIKNPTHSQNPNDSFDNYGEIKLVIHGAFQFYFTSNGTNKINDKIGEGYFIVDPRFSKNIDKENAKPQHYELNGITVQTYLGKNLGYFNKWLPRMMDAVKGKYNMVHFTPLQELGGSRSAYSLRNQLRVNPEFTEPGKPEVTWNDIKQFIDMLHKDYNILSMTDLVLNHTSYDSPWLQEHPECGYNLVNSPHLRPAYLIDRAIYLLNIEVAENKFIKHGLSSQIDNESHVSIVEKLLWEKLNSLNLVEFYLAHVDNVINGFRKYLEKLGHAELDSSFLLQELKLVHGNYRRLGSTVNYDVAAAHCYVSHRHIDAACNKLRELLNNLNNKQYEEMQSHLQAAVTNVLANVRWRFLNEHGEKLGKVTADTPLMWFYFNHPFPKVIRLADCETLMDSNEQRIMAYNGWVIGDDPLRNFAEESSNVYLRRELVVWGDSCKLRYGSKPDDCPYLWNHMSEYSAETARIFHAVRLDNCHSIQIEAAQAFLDRARATNPNLYIIGELFTGSQSIDNAFVNKLGINSLVRESSQPANCNDLGALIHRYGSGSPSGSFAQQCPRFILPSTAHAIVYDRTHDNRSAITDRSPFDLIPTAAVLSMACCAVGSTWGYDQIVPEQIDVVKDERMYPMETDVKNSIVEARGVLNELHSYLASHHYTESFIDQLDGDVVSITRSNPTNSKSVILISHSSFHYPSSHNPEHRKIRSIEVNGTVSKVLFEIRTKRNEELIDKYKRNPDIINGLPGIWGEIYNNIADINKSRAIKTTKLSNGNDRVDIVNLPPGSVVAFEVELTEEQQNLIADIKSSIAMEYNTRVRSGSTGQTVIVELMLKEQLSKSIDSKDKSEDIKDSFREMLTNLSLTDLSILLYRCEAEELMDTDGIFGAYNLDGFGKFVYCGLQGVISLMDHIRLTNDLGHPLCANLRAGNWLMDYLSNRLEYRQSRINLCKIAGWLRKMFEPVGKLPRYLVPCYFEMIISGAYRTIMEEVYYRLGDNIVFGSSFIKNLGINSLILCSHISGLKLPPIKIPEDQLDCISYSQRASLSAGFPHFAEGIWRNWGRDTFISLRGLLLLQNRLIDSEQIILTYAATVRHGLIPNLLGDGTIARYNARDATWFWLEAIKQYEICRLMHQPDYPSIVTRKVIRMYPSDETDYEQIKNSIPIEQSLSDIIQEIMQRLVDGIHFRERNAGPKIDEQMTAEGFDIEVGIRHSNKFVYGGNEWNCGTWMDKMGSSGRAGNKGRPATPRDGSAVELVALCASVLEWLLESNSKGTYPFKGVNYRGGHLSWQDWHSNIKEYFDDMFYIPADTTDPHLKYNAGIYRDSVNSMMGFTDNQFRPNFLIAMTVAPNLFIVDHAWHALQLAERKLLGKLGMKTLSDHDQAYRGYYDNSNDSCDASIAKGFNYHQGPEWLWLTGFYLRAKLIFGKKIGGKVLEEAVAHVKQVLGRLQNHIEHDPWKSLPELTNRDGEYCHHSCAAQAWSIATNFEAVYDLLNI